MINLHFVCPEKFLLTQVAGDITRYFALLLGSVCPPGGNQFIVLESRGLGILT